MDCSSLYLRGCDLIDQVFDILKRRHVASKFGNEILWGNANAWPFEFGFQIIDATIESSEIEILNGVLGSATCDPGPIGVECGDEGVDLGSLDGKHGLDGGQFVCIYVTSSLNVSEVFIDEDEGGCALFGSFVYLFHNYYDGIWDDDCWGVGGVAPWVAVALAHGKANQSCDTESGSHI